MAIETASMLAYTWDLYEEGLEQPLENIADVAGCNEIALAVSYHISTYFLPHNPKRKLYYGEHGAEYFYPDLRLYENTKIHPRVSDVVTGPEFLPDIVRAIKDKGLRFTAWVVYFYNHHLARKYPECARMDALGNRYLAQLCPANPDVRAYALALTEDVVSNYEPQGLLIESLSYLPFEYGFLNPKVLMEITPRCQFLMGICLCAHCRAAAQAAGLDADGFANQVAAFLEQELVRNPTDADRAPVSDEWLSEAFDGELALYLAARGEVAQSLFQAVVEKARSFGVEEVHTSLGRSSHVSGLNQERVLPLIDSIGAGLQAGSADEMRSQVAAAREALPPDKRLSVGVAPATAASHEEIYARIKAASEGGADGVSFYNYGLLREEYFRWIGAARELWTK